MSTASGDKAAKAKTLHEQALKFAAAGDTLRAESLLRESLALVPTQGALVHLATIIYNGANYGEAVVLMKQAMQGKVTAEFAEAYAHALEESGRGPEAARARKRLYESVPSALHGARYAATLVRQGKHDQVDDVLPELLTRYPDDKDVLEFAAVWRLSHRNFADGWEMLRRRRAVIGPQGRELDIADLPAWKGTVFDGILLVTGEPHIGEEILVSGIFAELAKSGQRAMIEVDPRLVPLLSRSFPTLEIVPRGSSVLEFAREAGVALQQATTLDLVELYKRDFHLPGDPAWLVPDADRVQKLRGMLEARFPDKVLVGICWRSTRHFNGRDLKSIPLTGLRATMATPGVAFIDVQYGDFAEDRTAAANAGMPLPWNGHGVDTFNDIDGLAALMCALDEVVMVSNTTAHLAGALGVPTTVLLPKSHPIHWHWGYEGDETTWYGSVQLLRSTDASGIASLDGVYAAQLRERS